jgi:hypothetical protein
VPVGGAATEGAPNVPNEVAVLSPNPRTLYLLWEEYQHGIGGRKAARLFSAPERGRVKHKYHCRKVVWTLVSALVRSGLTANVALDRIYQVYGAQATVTTIINRLKRDIRDGTLHPDLTV